MSMVSWLMHYLSLQRFPGAWHATGLRIRRRTRPGTRLAREPGLARSTSISVSRTVSTWAWAWPRADDVGLGEPGDEHRDVSLPDLVLAAEVGEAGHEVVAVLERHPERAPGLQLACLHLRPPPLCCSRIRPVQKPHPLLRKPSGSR